jgi:hypothetical protein
MTVLVKHGDLEGQMKIRMALTDAPIETTSIDFFRIPPEKEGQGLLSCFGEHILCHENKCGIAVEKNRRLFLKIVKPRWKFHKLRMIDARVSTMISENLLA